jgi:CMP-N-acetylneuraminic acid synthetase
LIPARGGSKGVPNKNLRRLNGKPLFEYAIDAAFECQFIDEIILSSDSDEILKLGEKLGVVTHVRSLLAASDISTASQVVLDVIFDKFKHNLSKDNYFVYLQPTSPFRTGAHITSAFELMGQHCVDGCISVIRMLQSPYKSYVMNSQGRLKSIFDEEKTNANRQTLPIAYYPNGAIYIFTASDFLRKNSFPTNGSVPLIMSPEDSIDIDTEQDFFKAESLCRQS